MNKWIIKQTNDPLNSEAFIHYQNIELNTNSFNDLNFNLALNTGTIEDLKVNINWKEIFRYWTEIKTKYYIETYDDEEDEVMVEFENLENSLIKIKGLVLDLSFKSPKYRDSLVDEPEIVTTDVDLMKDFLNHIIGQFNLEIENVKLILNNNLIIKIPSIIILPEINGLRRIIIPEDITIQNEICGRVLKGTEILIMRTIEGDVINIKIPGIEIGANDMNSLIVLLNSFNSETTKANNKMNTNMNVTIDTFKLSINPLTLFLHDIWIDSSGSFVIGHFNLKLKDYSIIISPIQTHVVTGDFKNNRVVIEEEVIIRLKDMKQIEDIKQIYETTINNNYSDTNEVKYQVDLRSVVLVIDEFNINVHDIIIIYNLVSIENIGIKYKSSNLSISNIKYLMKSGTNSSSLEVYPFAELKMFIENDEILSIEDENVLYEKFKGLINNLYISSITGTIELDDMKYLKSIMSNDTSNAKSLFKGTVDNIDVSLKLSNETVYAANLRSISFLKTEGFFDLRSYLDYFKRNDQIIIDSVDLVVVNTDDILVSNLENLNLFIPYNIHKSLTDDIKIINSILSSKTSSVNQNDFQLSFKNSKIKLGTPDDLKEPVESEFFIKEINCKSDVLYVDEAILKLNNEMILNSGLLKINYSFNSIEVHNHFSNFYLDQVAYQNLIKFSSFWSEIYSPAIEEIKPEAVFHDESSFYEEAEADEEGDSGISGFLMQFEGEGTEDFELELELEVSEEINSEPSRDDNSNFEVPSGDNLTDLLKDIDEEFFINKQKEIIDDSYMKISNFGIKINLVLSLDSTQKDLTTISLKGIAGTISKDKISLKCKEGSIHRNGKTILHRWPRGPDVTCKYPIEDGNFFTIKSEKLEIKNDAGIDEFNLMISVCPLRLFLDQKCLNDLATFFKNDQVIIESSDKLKSFIFFNKVNINPLALKIDYYPNSSSAPIPLQGAEMILPRVELRGVKGFEGLGPAVFSAWLPELKGKKLTGVLTTGLVPVRTIVNLGGGVAELILLPWQLGPEQSAAQTVAQIRKNGKRIGLETLKLTASLASRTSKLLSTEQPPSSSTTTKSIYPTDFQSGVQQAAQLIIALPTRLGKSNKGALRAVPLIILDSAATATGALAKTLQGIQADFDKEIDYERKIKRK